MYVYSNSRGYTDRAFLAGDTEPAMNGTDAQEHHDRATNTMIHRAMMLVTHIVMMAATSSGKMQYPSRHIDWKKPMFPPSSTTLQVRTTAPADSDANTSCMSKFSMCPVFLLGVDAASVVKGLKSETASCIWKAYRENTAGLLRIG